MPEETAKVVYAVEDSGHYGAASCGKCHAQLSDDAFMVVLERCPFCNVKLIDDSDDIGYPFGGSDF